MFSGGRRILYGIVAAVGCAAAMMVWAKTTSTSPPSVVILRTPGGGIQPQAVLGRDGVLRMIYFEGNPAAGNIEYVTRERGARSFSAPIRVNSQPGSAVAIGSVRGPQMAVGQDGRVYVIWFGSAQARPRSADGKTPVLFSRLNAGGAVFSPQRNLMQWTRNVDGGLSIAADQRGDLYAVWHARGAEPGEAHRRVYLAVSHDNGNSFSREVPVSPASLGACGCCGMKAFVDRRGALFILYRTAAEGIHRDMTLLVSTNGGRSFMVHDLSRWKLDACPMSTAALAEGGGRVLAAWEKAGQVFFDQIDPRTLEVDPALAAPGVARSRKHPVVAENAKGQVVFAWTEGTAWMKGGSVAWQLFNSRGEPIARAGHASGLPVWGLPSVVAAPDGNFTLIY